MTTMSDLIAAALAAADLFREGDAPLPEVGRDEIRQLVRAADTHRMTNQYGAHDWDGCLMCAVRSLTEGRAREWGAVSMPELAEGDTVTGVVLRQGTQPTYWQNEPVPFVELWTGGINRIRVVGHGIMLREALISAEIQVGDTLTVRFEGTKTIPAKGRQPERSYKAYTVSIERGHH